MRFNLQSITKNLEDNEDIYAYANEAGLTVKFQADPEEAFSWLFYKSSTAPTQIQGRLVEAFVMAGLRAKGDASLFAENIKTLTV